jgi:hypothetical protein
MCEMPRWNPLEQSVYTSTNENQEGKTGPVWGWILLGGINREDKQRVKEGKYGACTLYMCIQIKQWNLF